MKYSFLTGLRKGLESALMVTLAVVTMLGLADQDIWGLFEQYVRPYTQGLTLAAAVTMALNYIKIKLKGG